MGNTIKTAKDLRGAYVASITHMQGNNPLGFWIDHTALSTHFKKMIKAGIDGICVGVTTSQCATLDHEEQIRLIDYAYSIIDGNVPLIGGGSSNSTREALRLTRGINAIDPNIPVLHTTGYYNGPPPEGQYEHFMRLADVGSKIILYNVPSRTANPIQAETIIKLSKHENIIGLKQATDIGLVDNLDDVFEEQADQYKRATFDSIAAEHNTILKLDKIAKQIKNRAELMLIIEETNSDTFRILSGECSLVYRMLEMGGYGTISASANVRPGMFAAIVVEYFKGNTQRSRELQDQVQPIVEAVFCAKNPIPLHYMLQTKLRLPLVPIDMIALGEEKMKKCDEALANVPDIIY